MEETNISQVIPLETFFAIDLLLFIWMVTTQNPILFWGLTK